MHSGAVRWSQGRLALVAFASTLPLAESDETLASGARASETAPIQPRESPPKERGPSPWLTGGVPALVAVASLFLSIYTLIVSNRPPDVTLSVPDRVRLAQGQDGAWLYLQPRFVSSGHTERVEVITGIRVLVTRGEEENPVAFIWSEQGEWAYDLETNSLSWTYVGDPAPLVVGPASPQLPIGLFTAPTASYWEAGDYRLTIVADRAIEQAPLSESFALHVSPEIVAQLDARRGEIFLTLPTEPLDD